jgi:hypothetical protein
MGRKYLAEKFGFVLENEPISGGVLRLTEDIFQVLDGFLGAGFGLPNGLMLLNSTDRLLVQHGTHGGEL